MYNKKFIILPVTVIFLLVVFFVTKNAQATVINFVSGLTSQGNVGIGTTAPVSKLHVIANGGFVDDTHNAGQGVPIVAEITADSTFFGVYNKQAQEVLAWNILGSSDATHRGVPTLYDKYNGTWNQGISQMNGLVGIGKTNPSTALDVNGTVTATGFSGSGANLTGVVASTYNGTVSSANVSAGSFGGNTGGGNYTFPSAFTGQGGTHIYSMPWFNAGGAPNGYIKLVTPIVDTESNMFTIKITGYMYGSTYGGGSIVNITCGGYAYSGNPSGSGLVSAQCASGFGSNLPAEIGEENRGGTYYIVIRLGTPTSSWYYNHFTAEYVGWQSKSPNGFTWVTGETTPAQSGNNHNVVIDDRGGTINTSGAVNFANALKVNSSGITSWGGSDQGIMTWDTGYASIYASSGNVLRLGANGTQSTLTINNGNVGIGTTAPNGKLEILSGNSDSIVFGQINGDNTNSIQSYIDGQWANRSTYASGCCNTLYIQKDAGDLVLGNARGISVPGTITAGGFSGPMSGTLNAANVSSGTFGNNTGGGAYTFPGTVNITGTNSLTFSSYAGGWYMQDGTWLRSTNGNSVWLGGGNYGTNGGLTLGYGGATPPGGGIITTGSVGVGTQSPAEKLNVSSGNVQIDPSGGGQVWLGRVHSEGGEIKLTSTGGGSGGWIQGNSGGLRFVDYGWSKTTFGVDNTGNATFYPSTSHSLYLGQDTGATAYNSISLNGNTTDAGNMGFTGGGGSDSTLYINSPGNIWMRTNSFSNNGAVDVWGNLGVGVASPGYKLDVIGNGAFRSGDNSYVYYGPNGTWGGALYVGATPNRSGASTAQVISTNGNLHLDAGSGNDMYLNYYSNGRPIHMFGAVDMNSSLSVAGTITAGGFSGNGSGLTSVSASYANSAGNADTVDGIHGTSFTRNDTTSQYLKPFYEYGNYLTSEAPSNLRDQMGGGGLRVDFMHPGYTANGQWGQTITWSGYQYYGMYQLAGGYGGSTPSLAFRNEVNAGTNTWTGWRTIIDSGTIGSQSVNYASSAGSATNAGNADTVDGYHASYFVPLNTWFGSSAYYGSNGDIYMSWLGWLSSNLNQDVRNGSSPRFGSLYVNNGGTFQQEGYNNNGYFAMNNASTYWGIMGNYGANDWRLGYGSPTSLVGWNLRWDNGGNVWTNGSLDTGGSYVYAGELYTRDNLYLAYMGNWMSNLLNQNVRTDSNPTFQHIYANEMSDGNGRIYLAGNLHIDAYNGNAIYLNYYSGAEIRMYGHVWTSGDINVSGNIYGNSFQYSDETLKKNITTINDPIGKIMQLRGVTFNWNKDNKAGVGVIAQEVEKVYPELVNTDKDGIKSVQYTSLVAPLIEAVKAQQKEILDLKANDNKQSIILNKLCKDQSAKKTSSWKTICTDYLAK